MVFLGNPEYVCELQPIDFAAVARGFGAAGFSVDDPARCREVLQAAMNVRGPALVEAVVDPHEPPMPPKATLKQVTNLAESLARGTPAGRKILSTVASDIVREIV
jgi:pyruvate dehydrogenase (quinone)/pyruvate oxidase